MARPASNPEELAKFASYLKRLRKVRGWGQVELGQRAGGLAQSTISAIETGTKGEHETLEPLARLGGFTFEEVMSGAALEQLEAEPSAGQQTIMDEPIEPYVSDSRNFAAFAFGRLLEARSEKERRQFREALAWGEAELRATSPNKDARYDRDEMDWAFAMGLHFVRGDTKPQPLRSEVLGAKSVDATDAAIVATTSAKEARFVPPTKRRTSRVPAEDDQLETPAQGSRRRPVTGAGDEAPAEPADSDPAPRAHRSRQGRR